MRRLPSPVSLAGLLFVVLFAACPLPSSVVASEQLEFQDGERVVMLGDSLIEQEQYSGWVELMLTTAFPDRQVTFRNLGWSADTPDGKSRAGLSLLQAGKEGPDEGWKQLQSQLELTRPTFLILGYGMASALEGGEAGVSAFVRDYQRLLKRAREISPEIQFLFLSPLQSLDPAGQLSTLPYTQAIRDLAQQYSATYVDLSQFASVDTLRQDPIHLNAAGYRGLAAFLADALQLPDAWQNSPHAGRLRDVIVRKNEWWFHRSRPANMAYVFGFRKHEQGQNAAEIPQFDELVAAEESKIAKLRGLKPVELPEDAPRIESNFAEFSEQPRPTFTVADDWEVTLWAENPQLNKPIHMNFDPQGRLWVASSEAYPMIEVGQAAPDKILVLEDTTGDGKADTSTVFAEGLLIPTGVAPGNGGVYVAQSTDLLFLKDTDGDGRADSKERILSGFGTEDTHHNLHTLVWGPDGRLYMNQSVYTRTDAETPHGIVRLRAGGGFRYDPRSMHMEVVFRGLWNSWGHQFDSRGQSFLTDGAGFDGVAYTFPTAVFNPTPGARRQLELISPGKYPKFASLEIIDGDSYPPEWQGSLVTCDFRANRVTRFSLKDLAAGFVTQQEDDLLRTSASSFRPIDVKQGPDGALYIADWSNPIINHGEVDFRDPRRDRWHGRIWRVAWKGSQPLGKRDLTGMSVPELLDLLSSHDRYLRDAARRVLTERADQVQPHIDSWITRLRSDAERLQCLWLHQSLNTQELKILDRCLSSSEPQIRAAATRVLSYWADPAAVSFSPLSTSVALNAFEPLVGDEHPRVRLEAVHGLARLGSAEAGLLALQVLDKPMDRFLEFALAEAIEQMTEPVMEAIESGRWVADTPLREKQLEFVLTSIDPPRASGYLTQRLARVPLSRDGAGPWIELIGRAGGVDELSNLFSQAVAGEFAPQATVRALRAVDMAYRVRKLKPRQLELGQLLEAKDDDVVRAAVELVGTWKLSGKTEQLETLANSPNTSKPTRLAAIQSLAAVGAPGDETALSRLANSDQDIAIRQAAVIALASQNMNLAVESFYRVLAELDSESAALQLWRGMLANPQAGKVLSANLPSDGISETAAVAGVRAAQDGGRDEPELLASLTPLSGLQIRAEELSPERIQTMAKQVASIGDPHRGEQVYRRPELACASCHAIGGVGGKVGPDMTSLGASAPVDYIIESLYNPNAKIKEGFHSVVVATEDGQIINGIEVENNAQELLIRDVANKLVRVPQSEVAAKKAGGSLMPTGVVDRLSQSEQIDLISFLSNLGKPGDFDASQAGVARVFEIFAGTHRIEQLGAERIINGELQEGWKPLAAYVDGSLPASELVKLTAQPINIALVHVYARTVVSVPQDGDVTFRVPGNAPVAMWVDGEPVAGAAQEGAMQFVSKLTAGDHTVLVRLDARELPNTFRLLARGVTFASEL